MSDMNFVFSTLKNHGSKMQDLRYFGLMLLNSSV